jgi:hypothetical protein
VFELVHAGENRCRHDARSAPTWRAKRRRRTEQRRTSKRGRAHRLTQSCPVTLESRSSTRSPIACGTSFERGKACGTAATSATSPIRRGDSVGRSKGSRTASGLRYHSSSSSRQPHGTSTSARLRWRMLRATSGKSSGLSECALHRGCRSRAAGSSPPTSGRSPPGAATPSPTSGGCSAGRRLAGSPSTSAAPRCTLASRLCFRTLEVVALTTDALLVAEDADWLEAAYASPAQRPSPRPSRRAARLPLPDQLRRPRRRHPPTPLAP